MKKRYIDYILLSFLSIILFLLMFLGFYKYKNNFDKFIVKYKVDNKTQEINYFYDDELNQYYFFMPSCYNKFEGNLQLRSGICLRSFDEEISRTYTKLEDIKFNEDYEVYQNGNNIGNLVFMHSKNIPSMYIKTSNGNIKSLEVDKKLSQEGKMLLINEDGSIEYNGLLNSISGRGNSTWEQEKKGWEIELSIEKDLLGMATSTNWILLANFLDDTSGLRNYTTYNMSSEIGLPETSKLTFIDLYIDGNYNGTYQLCEKIKENKERLPIGDLDNLNNSINKCVLVPSKLTQTVIEGEEYPIKSWSNISTPKDITGGYIVERNYGYKLIDKYHVFNTDGGEPYVIRYPSVVSKEENDYINNIMNQIERALFSSDYKDPQTGKELSKLIDLDSWVLKYLVDETTKNEGAASTSSYYYKKQGDDLIYGGPIWDYDKAYGVYFKWTSPYDLTYSSWHEESPCYWYERLYNYGLANTLIKKYYKERLRPYLQNASNNLLDDWSKTYIDSYNMNYCRWRKQLIQWEDDKDSAMEFYSDLSNPIDYMRNWINERILFLDYVWVDEKQH